MHNLCHSIINIYRENPQIIQPKIFKTIKNISNKIIKPLSHDSPKTQSQTLLTLTHVQADPHLNTSYLNLKQRFSYIAIWSCLETYLHLCQPWRRFPLWFHIRSTCFETVFISKAHAVCLICVSVYEMLSKKILRIQLILLPFTVDYLVFIGWC